MFVLRFLTEHIRHNALPAIPHTTIPPLVQLPNIARAQPLLSYNSISWNRRNYEPQPYPSHRPSRSSFMAGGMPPRIDWVDTASRPPLVMHAAKKMIVPTRIGVFY
mmetsp:Transcript_33181/g.75008  ORF Transcript_33181/g.75008 Transcript_33181/m.75008 type:complete len:106 (-) Transcript_33181:364-681(-)